MCESELANLQLDVLQVLGCSTHKQLYVSSNTGNKPETETWLAVAESSTVVRRSSMLLTTVTGANHGVTLPPVVEKLLQHTNYSGLKPVYS